VSNTADPAVTSQPVTAVPVTTLGAEVTASDRSGTELWVRTAGPDGAPNGRLTVAVRRVLRPGDGAAPDDSTAPARPCVSATWQRPDGTRARGTLITARYTALPAARP
jgi:hypothetical protein